MELREYWGIVRRRWWIIAGLLVVVALLSLPGLLRPRGRAYTVTMRFNVGITPEEHRGDDYAYDHYYTWLASEYLMDDLAAAVRGGAFAAAVHARLGAEAPNPAGAFAAATEHRVLSVYITWGDEAQLREIANATVAVLQEEGHRFVGPLGEARPVLRLIDPPMVAPAPRSLREKLDLPLRLGLALLAGVALTFLLDYLDDSVRSRAEVEAMGIPVLGEVPRLLHNRN